MASRPLSGISQTISAWAPVSWSSPASRPPARCLHSRPGHPRALCACARGTCSAPVPRSLALVNLLLLADGKSKVDSERLLNAAATASRTDGRQAFDAITCCPAMV